MQNFYAEFKKFSSREFDYSCPINIIQPHHILCQDHLFDMTQNFVEHSNLKFSLAYFFDYRKIRNGTEWNQIYVLDGVAELHKFSGSHHPLVRDRELYYYLYVARNRASALANALITNPWLYELFKPYKQFLSEKAEAIDNLVADFNTSVLTRAITDHLSADFTPRGIWGLDSMFRWKKPHQEAEVEFGDKFKLITLDEYIKYFEG